MTFKYIAIKNFLAHSKRYISYLLCSSFTIMVFFIYSTLFFNDPLMSYAKRMGFDVLIYISIVVIVLFSVFFIHYAHTTFVNSRTHEFALLMTLGLVKKNISRMIVLENVIILAVSMTLGLFFGGLFSRIFFLIIRHLIQNVELEYVLDGRSFLLTLSVFVVIFAFAIFMSKRVVTKLSIVQLLKKKREMVQTKNRIWLGSVGCVLFVSALVFVFIITKSEKFSSQGYWMLVYAVVAFVSMYWIISQFGSLILHFMKRNKKRYYQNILSISEIEYTFAQNKKIIFVLSLLSAMIIFFVASPFSLYSISKEIADDARIADYEYVETATVNHLSEGKLETLAKQSQTPLLENLAYDFLMLPYQLGNQAIIKPIISESLYQTFNKETLGLRKGQIVQLVTTWLPSYTEFKDRSTITLESFESAFELQLVDTIKGKGINFDVSPSQITLVVSDEDYLSLEALAEPGQVAKLHLMNFNKWEETEGFYQGLMDNLENKSDEFPIAGTLLTYHETKSVYAMMLFFTSFMGLLFFVSGGSILYFKQYGDMERLRDKYKKLSKIGLTKGELIKIYATTLKINFFTPFAFGTVIGFAFMYMTTFLVGGGNVIVAFLKGSVLVTVCYFIFQLVYYRLSLSRYRNTVTKSDY